MVNVLVMLPLTAIIFDFLGGKIGAQHFFSYHVPWSPSLYPLIKAILQYQLHLSVNSFPG